MSLDLPTDNGPRLLAADRSRGGGVRAATKPTVLVLIAHYRPGWKFGGPIQTIANLIENLGDEFDFRIITSDHDFGERQPFDEIVPDRWQQVGKAHVFYASRKRRRFLSLSRLLRETHHDVLYINSFFHPRFTLAPLLARRLGLAAYKSCILAPRGELARSALGLRAAKKAWFMKAAGAIGLYDGLRWQATAPDEADDIRREMGLRAQDIVVAGNLAGHPEGQHAAPRHALPCDGPLRVVFLSRLSRIKNLDFALRVLACCAVPVAFDVWCTCEDETYWRECTAIAATLPDHVSVQFRGGIDHARVAELLARYDLLLLPTKGENFGHVIAESLAAGTPVLISNRTPWRGLADDGIGWDLPIDRGTAAFASALEAAFHERNTSGEAWRGRVLDFARRATLDLKTIDANRRLFVGAAQVELRVPGQIGTGDR